MKYRDIIHFDPPQKIIQLVSSRDAGVAAELVSTFVISDRMATAITAVMFHHLQFDRPHDNKALLIVGNYGTGKSHLLSLVASLAENAALVPQLRSAQVQAAAGSIAGRFKVLRLEVGSTKMVLRSFICEALQTWLREQGVTFSFKPMDKVWENKQELGRMMAAFQAQFPEHGLLVVIDELLDYLRSRTSQELPLDLGFLREIGEVCRDLRLRFVAGLQESLFESQQFQFAADSLNRVKDRFTQVRIAREDLAYVVSERLLRKTPAQKQQVRDHLTRFTPLFGTLQERLDDYVNLFPIHPAYLEVFERVRTGEKRQALESLSNAMVALLDQDVPADRPGLISYDQYWSEIKDNAGYRADPDIGKVIRCAEALEARVQSGFTNAVLKRLLDPARHMLHALAVQRLTDGDINAAVGVTIEQLRDELTLVPPGMPVRDAAFLKTTLETALREVSKVVSGQFLTHNSENGQYYLDIHKDIDFDAQIRARADILDLDTLDRYYYHALSHVMERAKETYVPGSLIWEFEVEWREHKTTRPGYLFFGTPRQRDTAHPPQEFYLYFLQPFSPSETIDDAHSDEIFFRLLQKDEKFVTAIKLFAAATELAQTSGGYRQKYEEKASAYFRQVTSWLSDSFPLHAEVTYQGQSRRLLELTRAGATSRSSLRELITHVASSCLSDHFQEKLPDYPRFPALVTRDSRRQGAAEAIASLCGTRKVTSNGRTILEGLELLLDDQVRVIDHRDPALGSRYATFYYQELMRRGVGQVLNRSEMMVSEHNGKIQYDRRFHLEPELMAVVLVAQVAAENVTLAVSSKKFDASQLAELARMNISDLAEFNRVERPRELDTSALRELFKLVELNEGLARTLENGGPDAQSSSVQQLQERVSEWLGRSLSVQQLVRDGLSLWEAELLSTSEKSSTLERLRGLSEFLNVIRRYQTPASFKNLKVSAPEIAEHHPAIASIKQLEHLSRQLGSLQSRVSYLSGARGHMPDEHAWCEAYEALRQEVLTQLRLQTHRSDPSFYETVKTRLDGLKKQYADIYTAYHSSLRLGQKDDARKGALISSKQAGQLRMLTGIHQLPAANLDAIVRPLAGIKSCWALTTEGLRETPLCAGDRFSPASEHHLPPAKQRLEAGALQLEHLLRSWTEKLLADLQDPVVEERLPLLTPKLRNIVLRFVEEKALPDPVDQTFVDAVNAALEELIPVELPRERLIQALDAGSAMTVDKFKARFDALVQELSRGKDPKKIRILVVE